MNIRSINLNQALIKPSLTTRFKTGAENIFANPKFHLGRVFAYSTLFVSLVPQMINYVPGIIPTLAAGSLFELYRNWSRGRKVDHIA
jgi:hypothetical protein